MFLWSRRALSAAGVSMKKEPAGLVQTDWDHPEGCPKVWLVSTRPPPVNQPDLLMNMLQTVSVWNTPNCPQLTSFRLWLSRYGTTNDTMAYFLTWDGKSLNVRTIRLMFIYFPVNWYNALFVLNGGSDPPMEGAVFGRCPAHKSMRSA